MVVFRIFTVCGGFTRSMVIFRKLSSQCIYAILYMFFAIYVLKKVHKQYEYAQIIMKFEYVIL